MTLISYDYKPGSAATVLSLDLATKQVTDMSQTPATMDVPAAMYPDDAHVLIRSTRHTQPEGVMPKSVGLRDFTG